ncbi:hypothetical protein Tco_0967952 [Tanacetum coccineum]
MGVGTRGVEESEEKTRRVRFGLQTNPESRIEFSLIKIGVRQLVKRTLDVVLENIWSIDGWTVLIRHSLHQILKFRDFGCKSTTSGEIPEGLGNRFNDLLRACPHHGFSELHQLDTFYNALNANDQDSLNSAAGGNFLDKMPRECLRIIESKSKVRNSRNKAVVAKVSSNSSTPGISPDVAALTTEVSELKNLMKTMLIDKQKVQAPATVKAVEQSCVTCGGTHSYKNCPATDGNVYQDNIQEYVSQAAAANFNQGNTNSRPADGQGLQNQMTNLTEMLSKFITSNTTSSSNSETLPSQTVTNPREHVNAITTRSGKTCKGPSTPLVPTPVVSIPLKEPKRNPETSMDKVQKPSSESTAQVSPPEEEDSIFIEIPKPKAKKTINVEIQDLNSPRPNSYQSKLPYPERMKVRENDKPSAQHSRNKEKLEEIAITTVNAECSAIIMNKVPEKLEDP